MSIKFPQLQNRDWLEEQVKLKSLRLIAQDIGCSYGAISYTMRKFKLDIPDNANRQKRPTEDLSEKSKRGLALKYPNGRFGRLASNWKGGRKTIGKGYVYIYNPKHKYATKDGYVMEHRLVMEKKVGRFLKPTEMVHHLNGIRDDNRTKNLQLVQSKAEHFQAHFEAVKEVDRLKRILKKNHIRY